MLKGTDYQENYSFVRLELYCESIVTFTYLVCVLAAI